MGGFQKTQKPARTQRVGDYFLQNPPNPTGEHLYFWHVPQMNLQRLLQFTIHTVHCIIHTMDLRCAIPILGLPGKKKYSISFFRGNNILYMLLCLTKNKSGYLI